MGYGERYDRIDIMSVVPPKAGADERNASFTVYWAEQDDDGFFSDYAEHLNPDDVVWLVRKRKSDVYLTVIDESKDSRLGIDYENQQMSWIALQAAAAFGKVPRTIRNVVIIPQSRRNLKLARKLVSLGAVFLYTNSDALRDLHPMIPGDAISSLEKLPKEDFIPGDHLEYHAGYFCYVGEIPAHLLDDFAQFELETTNCGDCFMLEHDYGIPLSGREDIVKFLSFGLDEVSGSRNIPHVTTELVLSIPFSIRRAWPGYTRYHNAAIRAKDVFNLWRAGNDLYDGDTGRGFGNIPEDKLERAGQADILAYWQGRAEECGIKSMVEAYYSGIPYEDIVSGTGF